MRAYTQWVTKLSTNLIGRAALSRSNVFIASIGCLFHRKGNYLPNHKSRREGICGLDCNQDRVDWGDKRQVVLANGCLGARNSPFS